MSEQAKAIMSTIVIVACLALLGVMVYLRVDGAAIGALGTITAIVAWLSRTPDRKDPPPGATLVPLVAAGALLASILACGCADPSVTPKNIDTVATVTEYDLALAECRKKGKAAHDYDVYEACAAALDAKECAEKHLRCVDGGAK